MEQDQEQNQHQNQHQNQDTAPALPEDEISEAKPDEAKGKKDKIAEAKLMSISIAMFMAVVAMLGAVTAHRAALAEQDSLKLERRLEQGEMLELVHRQELLSKISSRTRYENSLKLHTLPADNDQNQAAKKPGSANRRQAALQKLHAEEEAARVRSLQPYLEYFEVDRPYGLESSFAMHSAEWLRTLGFDAVWKVPKEGASFRPIWDNLQIEVEKSRHKAMRLAAVVVLLVVALAVLTFAQLSLTRPKREKILVFIGSLLVVVGLAAAMSIDPPSARDYLRYTAGFGALALLGTPFARWFARRAAEESSTENEPVHPGEVDPALFAGLRLHTAPAAHGFGRFVISTIAITAVLSALSGFFYSRAAMASSQAAGAALEDTAELFRQNSSQTTTNSYLIGQVATAENYHLSYEAARQRLYLAKEQPELLSQKDAMDQLQLQREVLDKFEKEEPKIQQVMTSDKGPAQDDDFPRKLAASSPSFLDSKKALARWSINNDMSLGHQREATTFLGLLTVFAIALYLLGQALGMGRTNAASYVLVGFACVLVLYRGVGLFAAVEDKATVLKPPSAECRIPDPVLDNDLVGLEAEHFARGLAVSEVGWDDPGSLASAAREFRCAVEINPTFALANYYFALATNHANTPQLNEGGFVSLLPKDALGPVTRAEQKAQALLTQQGFVPPVALVNLGFDTYADGLLRGDRKTVERGRQASLAAVGLSTDDLVPRFNLGLAQLAEGHNKEALETYRQTVAQGEPGELPYVTNDAAIVGGAITDLEVFRQYCRNLNPAAYCKQFETMDLPMLKSEFVTAAWPFAKGRTLANSGIKMTDIHLTGSAAGLGWSGHVESPPEDPGAKSQDAVAILWYSYNAEWKAWGVLPAISERVKPGLYAHSDPHLFYSVLRASNGRMCMQSGSYRAEFYVDGELAGSQEITLTGEDLRPQVFPDLGVAVCHPASWMRWQPRDKDAIWDRGYDEPASHRGVFVFSFFDPQQNGKEAAEQSALRRAENILHHEGLAPEPRGMRELHNCSGLHDYPGEQMAAFSDGGGASIAKAWTTTEGLVNVVVVVDPHLDLAGMGTQTSPSAAQDRQDCEILLSATTVHQ